MHSVSQAGRVQCVQHTFGVATAVLDVAIAVLRQEPSASLPNRLFEAIVD